MANRDYNPTPMFPSGPRLNPATRLPEKTALHFNYNSAEGLPLNDTMIGALRKGPADDDAVMTLADLYRCAHGSIDQLAKLTPQSPGYYEVLTSLMTAGQWIYRVSQGSRGPTFREVGRTGA